MRDTGKTIHGTLVAGIVGAKTNNGLGVAGVAGGWGAQGARLMILQVGDEAPDGSWLDDAILYAGSKGAKIIQLSLSVPQTAAIDAALAAVSLTYGCLVVGGAGNESGGAILYPATNPYVMAVTATDQNDNWATFSSKGPETSVAAPGANIYSTRPSNGYTNVYSGTSYAAPHVSGIAALNKLINPALTNTQNRDIIQQSADDKGAPGKDDYYGWGRANAYQSVMLTLGTLNKTLSSQSTGFNGQRKLYNESNLHEVFTNGAIDGGEIYYRWSTDNGASWAGIQRLSDGSMGNLAPCLAFTGGSNVVVVAWQKKNGSNYDVIVSSTASGAWSRSTIASNVACASPGPLPVVAGNINTDDAVIMYRTSSGLKYSYTRNYATSWSAPATVPGTSATYNAPSASLYTAFVPSADVCNLAFSTDVGYSSQLRYCSYTFDSNTWSALTNLSSAVPSYYQQQRNPTVATSTDATTLCHVAWEATDMQSGSLPVIIHRKGTSGNFGSQYSVVNYQGAANPSISGLGSDNAWMVFQRTQQGAIGRVRYSYTNGQWSWGTPVDGPAGNYGQISIGSPIAKYLYTSGSASPYSVSLGSENLTKADPSGIVYARELNVIDGKTGASITLEIEQPEIVHADGTASSVAFADVTADSVLIPVKELLSYGKTKPFSLTTIADTLKVRCTIRSVNSVALVAGESSAEFSLNLIDAKTGKALSTLGRGTVAGSGVIASASFEIVSPGAQLLNLSAGTGFSLGVSLSGVNVDAPDLIASLGHIYRYSGGGAVDLPKEGPAQDLGPKAYRLEQNYPNPFNPSTTLRYELPEAAHVTLVVYNTLGQKVAELVNDNVNAGYHEVRWDALGLASGIYFARLTANNGLGQILANQTAKLVLVR
jgi:hypothetical protein